MNLPPLIPIIFLVLGALAVGASNLARLRRPTQVMSIAAGLSWAALLAVPHDPPVTQIIAAWQPVSVFTVPLSFRVDQAAWTLALGFMLMLVVTALTWGAYPGQHRPAPRAFSLLLIAAAIAGVFASNLLTLAIAWGLLDLIFVKILRLWVSMIDFLEDMRLSEEILDRNAEAYRKIRNTFRYLLGNLDGFDPDRDAVPYETMEPIDRWAWPGRPPRDAADGAVELPEERRAARRGVRVHDARRV